jgi:hypothetical protein
MNHTDIATDTVVAVLLADGWHRVVPGSFTVGALRFGLDADPGELGFRFEEADNGSPYRPAALSGSLNSILAVRQVASADRHPGGPARPTPRRWVLSTPEAAA